MNVNTEYSKNIARFQGYGHFLNLNVIANYRDNTHTHTAGSLYTHWGKHLYSNIKKTIKKPVYKYRGNIFSTPSIYLLHLLRLTTFVMAIFLHPTTTTTTTDPFHWILWINWKQRLHKHRRHFVRIFHGAKILIGWSISGVINAYAGYY